MRKTAFVVVGVTALSWSCAPSREAAFDVTRAEVERRTGQETRWYDDDRPEREVVAIVANLLGRELTSDAAAQIALLNNRALQARFAEIGLARAEVVRASTLVNPEVSAELLLPLTTDEMEGGVGVSLDFLTAAFRPAQRGLALAELEATQLDVAGAAIDVAYEARAALLALVSARQLVDTITTFVEASALTAEVAERLRAAGNITELALLRERELYASSRAQLGAQRAELVRARRRLVTALGVEPNTELRIRSALPPLPSEGEELVADVEQNAVQRSIDLEVARRRVDVAGRALGIADAQRYLPALGVGASGEKEEDGYLAGPSVSLALPLFDQGQGRVASREAELQRLVDRYAASSTALQAEAHRVAEELRIARQRAALLEREVLPLRTSIVELALLQYNGMAVGIFELLEAKRMQLEAGVQLADALRDYWTLRLAAEQLIAGRMPSFEARASSSVELPAGAGGAEGVALEGGD